MYTCTHVSHVCSWLHLPPPSSCVCSISSEGSLSSLTDMSVQRPIAHSSALVVEISPSGLTSTQATSCSMMAWLCVCVSVHIHECVYMREHVCVCVCIPDLYDIILLYLKVIKVTSHSHHNLDRVG